MTKNVYKCYIYLYMWIWALKSLLANKRLNVQF